MPKENLVLVHSFPTNSILLSGLIHFLQDHFEVYPVDLPGFISTNPPLRRISLDTLSHSLHNQIEKLELPHYIVAGISFGFWVATNSKLSRACRGIIAIEPYIDVRCLNKQRISLSKRFFYNAITRLILFLHLEHVIWNSRLWKHHYLGLSGYKARRSKLIHREIDPRTFFAVANLLLANHTKCTLHQLPHVLIINPEDLTLDTNYITNYFKNHSWQTLILKNKIGHYPRKVTKQYFQKKISKNDIERIYHFFNSHSKG
ncbi:hypothetical protein A2803_05105 [Candidatus Woesebacteria bacterium RIFCSPHIGHO2_01_FULL_44_21]|uniref:AB hydrolase-1 domain-containing protein n=1 Tax=Candidatus Woesebacteria bacterium RIFCSPHIGHO2_01_FULL_44_21 TaxID=1802503 RepID=A0A1F7YZZ6_9BACT|nr:MAG: hypothetical protein A2803_05105 [Candidatus Woesebacteria bacterium RIFCSPHIGHO2_01_FULL_44_21]OGM68886.1 MAG: hypothetical protein A2897_01870 [Candidatus Woesebacteria bacterium RIFCSPLOWO2_01_FULL_44_24b]